MSESSIHAGHRKRIRDSFLQRDISALPDHEILELLLFYAAPRGDTNALAHRLINSFGSLKSVLNADYEDLIKTQGVGEGCAVFLKLFASLSVRYVSMLEKENNMNDILQAAKTVYNSLRFEKNEKVIALFYDLKGKYINTAAVGSGGADFSGVDIRELAHCALRCGAYSAVLAHNHPGGFAAPSSADIEATQKIKDALEPLGVKLKDHIIVSADDFLQLAGHPKYRHIFD